jgi:hypothetical protein
MGETRIDRILAYRGEYLGVGRVANEPPVKLAPGEKPKIIDGVRLIVWKATEADPETRRPGVETIHPVRTDALFTRTVLVDFDGGRWTRHAFKNLTEDAPAEVLLVDSVTGKMTARTRLKDKTDEQRVAQYDRWKPWFAAVMKRFDDKVKASQGQPKDRFGVGGGDDGKPSK